MSSEEISFDKSNFDQGLAQFLRWSKIDNYKREALNDDLQTWINHQNWCRKKKYEGQETALTEAMIDILDEVKFPWKICNDERWHLCYCELEEYKETHGDCRVPQKSSLGKWVRSQRKSMKQIKQGKKSSLTDERIEKLDSIGFEWDLNDWDKMFEDLGAFANEHGHCRVPRRCDALGRWVSNQRDRYKARNKEGRKSTMTEDEIEQLEAV